MVDRLAGGDVAARREIAEVSGGDLRVVAEVEVLERGELLEAGLADPPRDRGGVAPADLVFAEHLEELEVTELAGLGLREARVEGVEHPREPQGPQRRLDLMGPGHDATSTTPSSPSRSKSRRAPWRCAGATGGSGSVVVWVSVPAARMPLTVR